MSAKRKKYNSEAGDKDEIATAIDVGNGEPQYSHAIRITGVEDDNCQDLSSSFNAEDLIIDESGQLVESENVGDSASIVCSVQDYIGEYVEETELNKLKVQEPNASKSAIKPVQSDDSKVQAHGTPQSQNSFICTNCGNSYCGSGPLKLHMRACMRQRTEDPAEHRKCFLCNKVFSSVTYLNQHKLQHTSEQPFRCAHCYRKFIDEAKYKVHVEAHKRQYKLEFKAEALMAQNGGKKVVVKEFDCCFCSKSFTAVFDVHKVERRYVCDACLEKFSNHEALRQHKAMIEEKRQLACSRCGKKYIYITFLERHHSKCNGHIKK